MERLGSFSLFLMCVFIRFADSIFLVLVVAASQLQASIAEIASSCGRLAVCRESGAGTFYQHALAQILVQETSNG